jgi:hypothetical protein
LELQELMKFEQEAHVSTWMSDHLIRRNLDIKICEFSIYFKNLIRIYLNLDFGLLRSCLANGVGA